MAIEKSLSHPERTDFAAEAAANFGADCAMRRGDYATALERTIAAAHEARGRGDAFNAIGGLVEVAGALAALERDADAAEVLGAAEHLARRELGHDGRVGRTTSEIAHHLAAAEGRLEPAEWERSYAAGAHHDLEEALAPVARLAEPPR